MTTGLAKTGGAKTCTTLTAIGTINSAIANKIREIYSSKTAETLAVWLRISVRTAKHRLASTREFTLDEVAVILASEHGFQVIAAIMKEAQRTTPNWRAPDWWNVCEPLMDLADVERMAELARRRAQKIIRKREATDDALESEIRLAQTLAIQGSGPARARLAALQSYAGADRRSVAAGKGR